MFQRKISQVSPQQKNNFVLNPRPKIESCIILETIYKEAKLFNANSNTNYVPSHYFFSTQNGETKICHNEICALDKTSNAPPIFEFF